MWIYPLPELYLPLSFTNNSTGSCLISGSIIPSRVDNLTNCAGTITYTWQTTDFCGRNIFYQQVLTVLPPPEAQFINAPPSMTVNCPDVPPPGVLPPLSYTNNSSGNCLIQGTVIPTRVDNLVTCAGTITYTWQITDYCNRILTHTQVLTVLPPLKHSITNPPASMTIDCPNIPQPGVLPQLTYTNGSTGTCLIQGTVTPTRVDNITNCAGTITYTWQKTDYCGRNIFHQQILTVLPPPAAQFTNPPASMNIDCPSVPGPGVLPTLSYTNGSTGACLIQGTLTPTRVDNIVNCAGTITYTWQTTDYCNRQIQHVQVLTVAPPPTAQFTNPPIPGPGVLPTLSYTNGSTGTCLIQGTLTPTRVDNIVNCAGTITYTWQTTDYCNRPIQHIQVLTVTPPPTAQFTNPPASMTIDCPDIPAPGALPTLSYTNGSTGACLIQGTLTPTRVDNIVNCAGTITYTWQTTDYCNRPIQHIQVLTVSPPPPAQFTNASYREH
ncbi:MAG: hypothetical protein IPL08_00035 [Saprospiraceae bacterium]|nr:hypothetical protein [Saprospiraceae bacterium]